MKEKFIAWTNTLEEAKTKLRRICQVGQASKTPTKLPAEDHIRLLVVENERVKSAVGAVLILLAHVDLNELGGSVDSPRCMPDCTPHPAVAEAQQLREKLTAKKRKLKAARERVSELEKSLLERDLNTRLESYKLHAESALPAKAELEATRESLRSKCEKIEQLNSDLSALKVAKVELESNAKSLEWQNRQLNEKCERKRKALAELRHAQSFHLSRNQSMEHLGHSAIELYHSSRRRATLAGSPILEEPELLSTSLNCVIKELLEKLESAKESQVQAAQRETRLAEEREHLKDVTSQLQGTKSCLESENKALKESCGRLRAQLENGHGEAICTREQHDLRTELRSLLRLKARLEALLKEKDEQLEVLHTLLREKEQKLQICRANIQNSLLLEGSEVRDTREEQRRTAEALARLGKQFDRLAEENKLLQQKLREETAFREQVVTEFSARATELEEKLEAAQRIGIELMEAKLSL